MALGTTDDVLLGRARDGDEAAFTALYRRHHGAVYRLALTYRVPEPDELVDGAFAEAVTALRGGDGPEDRFRTWLFAALHRRAGARPGGPGGPPATGRPVGWLVTRPRRVRTAPDDAPGTGESGTGEPGAARTGAPAAAGRGAPEPSPSPFGAEGDGPADSAPAAPAIPAPVAAAAGRSALGGIGRETITRAFEHLAPQWQVVTWHAAVRGLAAPDLAAMLGVTPAGAEALARHAGEKLRHELLAAWLAEAPRPGCEPHRARLTAFRRSSLDREAQLAAAAHVERCDACRALLEELDQAEDLLVRSLVPLFPGAAAARAGARSGAAPPVAVASGPPPTWTGTVPADAPDRRRRSGGGPLPRDLRPALAGTAVVIGFVAALALFGTAMARDDDTSSVDALGEPSLRTGVGTDIGADGGPVGGDRDDPRPASGGPGRPDDDGDDGETAVPEADPARPRPTNPASSDDAPDEAPARDHPRGGDDPDREGTAGGNDDTGGGSPPTTEPPPSPTVTTARPRPPATSPSTAPPPPPPPPPPTTTTTALQPPHLVAAVAWRAGGGGTGTLTVTVSAESGSRGPAGGDLRVVVETSPGVALTGTLDSRCRSSGAGGAAGTIVCVAPAPAAGGRVQIAFALRAPSGTQRAAVTVHRGGETIGPQSVELTSGDNTVRRSE